MSIGTLNDRDRQAFVDLMGDVWARRVIAVDGAGVPIDFTGAGVMGNTTLYSGSVGTTAALQPSVSGDKISEILIRCASSNTNAKRLLWSIDNVTYHTLAPGEFVGWTMSRDLSNLNITQIYVKGSVAAVAYELIVNTVAV
jgi:hypothetical protein